MKTVKELIMALQKFPENMPVVYRKAEENGAYQDLELHEPSEFYPGGQVCLSAKGPAMNMDSSPKRPDQEFMASPNIPGINVDEAARNLVNGVRRMGFSVEGDDRN